MLRVVNSIRDGFRLSVSQPTEWQCVRNQIDAARLDHVASVIVNANHGKQHFGPVAHEICLSATTAVPAAFVVCFGGQIVILTFAFLRMPQRRARTVEGLGLGEWYVNKRIDELEKVAIRRFLVEIIGLVASSVTFATLHPVIIIIENFFEWATVDHGLIALKARTLFPLERLDRDRAKFDSVHSSHGRSTTLQVLIPEKAPRSNGPKKPSFVETAENAPVPSFRMVLNSFCSLFSLTKTAMAGGSPFFRTRKISPKNCPFDFG